MADSSEPSPKRIRKGTKSCIECETHVEARSKRCTPIHYAHSDGTGRTRKIRCVWEVETDNVCIGCKTRQKACVPQVYKKRTSALDSLLSGRIGRLERQIASIAAAAVQETGYGHSGSAKSTSTEEPSPRLDVVVESSPLEGPASTPPTHLRFLFDNSLISSSDQVGDVEQTSRLPCSPTYLEQTRAKLQTLMPTKGDVRLAADYGTAWMLLHQDLFSSALPFGSREALIDQYDDQMSPDADVLGIASFLLVFSHTIRQMPTNGQGMTLKDTKKYVQNVLHVVDTTIIAHTGIASTVKGLSTTVIYMRLQLGLGQIKSLWLTLRRTIAIAELIGLPRACNLAHLDNQRTNAKPIVRDPMVAEKAALWEAISAVDRLASMTFNLPAATATYHFPKRDFVSSTGAVIFQPYLLELAGIAMRVQQLDESYTLEHSKPELYEKVLRIDKDIRSLRSMTPASWWVDDDVDFSGGHLVKFWHFYLLVRTHVRSAMSDDGHDQYEYSRAVCVEACQTLAHRYAYVRRHIPPGFFACRILDIQIFAAAIFLVLSYGQSIAQNGQGSSANPSQKDLQLEAVQHILGTMDAVSDQVSSEFAQEAAATIRSLLTLAENPATATSQGLTLRIPLWGKIHITARKQAPRPQQSNSDMHRGSSMQDKMAETGSLGHEVHTVANVNNVSLPLDTFPWYMELDMNTSSLQEPFIPDELGDWDQWMVADGTGFLT